MVHNNRRETSNHSTQGVEFPLRQDDIHFRVLCRKLQDNVTFCIEPTRNEHLVEVIVTRRVLGERDIIWRYLAYRVHAIKDDNNETTLHISTSEDLVSA